MGLGGYIKKKAKSATPGAVIGGVLGGPVGAVIGGSISSAVGGPGGAMDSIVGKAPSINMDVGNVPGADAKQADWQAKSDAAASRQAQQVGLTSEDAANQAQTREQQTALNRALQDRVEGKGQSVAEMQFQQSKDAALNQALALRASARGVNPAVAQQQAAMQAAGITQQAAMGAAQLRAQEQQRAELALGQNLAGMRGQDLGFSEMGLKAGGMNQQAALQQQQLNDALVQKYLDAGYSLDIAQMNARVDLETARVTGATQNRNQNIQFVGQGMQAAGQVAATVAKA